jgi:hypothetical protein
MCIVFCTKVPCVLGNGHWENPVKWHVMAGWVWPMATICLLHDAGGRDSATSLGIL